MKQLPLTKEQIAVPVVWEPTGKSPGNTPQAKLQAGQLFMQMAANPATGIDVHALTSALIADSPLANATNIQISKEQMQQNAAQQQAQQSSQVSGPGPNPGIPQPGGGGASPVLPPTPQGIDATPIIAHGPVPVSPPGVQGPGANSIH